MSDDPLFMAGLEPEAIEEAVVVKKATKNSKDITKAKNAETAAKREERLAGGSRSMEPPSAPPPTPTPEPVKDKSELLDKIGLYKERFTHLKSRNKVSARSSIEEIEDELHYLEQQLGQRDGHMGSQIFILALTGVEQTSRYYNPLNLNLTGLANVAKDNEEQFAPILDELFIKYGASMSVGPEMRLAMATATLVYTVHAANTGNPAVAQAMAKMNQKAKAGPSDL